MSEIPERLCKYCSKSFIPNTINQKYCSKSCVLIYNVAMRKSRNLNLDTEHNTKVAIVSKIINGEIVANLRNFNAVNPDIITQDALVELELLGHHTLKNKSRWYKERKKKAILVISLRSELRMLFDEIYLLDEDVKSLKEFKHI